MSKARERVAILMCTYNGESFLEEQLQSFRIQTYKNWHLFVYDDISTDNTKKIIEDYKKYFPTDSEKINFRLNKSQMGFPNNFLNALLELPPQFNFFAFSDQDDIWCESKLEKAVNYLSKIHPDTPALYCSRTKLIDKDGKNIGYSPLFKKKPSFKNALVQSLAGGNTMVLNQSARNLITFALQQNTNVVSHDWFFYQIITGAGGHVYYDPHPEILYRQHDKNLIGSNNRLAAKVLRVKKLFNGSFKNWNSRNLEALVRVSSILTDKNKKALNYFIKSREASPALGLIYLVLSRVHRQTFAGNLTLIFGKVFNKL